jgi:hypothetical protein
MKVTITAIALSMMLAVPVLAVEPGTKPGTKDHELGRVFMSRAERARLDVLRKAPPSAGRSGPAGPVSQSGPSGMTKKPSPTGYIVPSSGRPYQWIDGDFRRVSAVSIDAVDSSRSINITRHEKRQDDDALRPGVEKPATSENDQAPDTVDEHASRNQQ